MTLWSVLDLLLGRWNPAKVMRDSGTMKWWWLVGSGGCGSSAASLDWLEISRKISVDRIEESECSSA